MPLQLSPLERISRIAELKAQYLEHMNNHGVVLSEESLERLILSDLDKESAVSNQPQIIHYQQQQPMHNNTHAKMRSMLDIVGRFKPGSNTNISQFLAKFTVTYTEIAGIEPQSDNYSSVRSMLLPLLEGAAFSAVHGAGINGVCFDDCCDLLKQRFGRDVDEAASLLVNTKQGNKSVDDYLTQVDEICREHNIDHSVIKFALKQNLNDNFANLFSQSLATQKLVSQKVDLSKSFKYLRSIASDITLRKPTGMSGAGGAADPCGYCGKAGHTEDRCFKKNGPPKKTDGSTHFAGFQPPTSPMRTPPTIPETSPFTGFLTFVDSANDSSPSPGNYSLHGSTAPSNSVPARTTAPVVPGAQSTPAPVPLQPAPLTSILPGNNIDKIDNASVDLIQQSMQLSRAVDPALFKPDEDVLAVTTDFMCNVYAQNSQNSKSTGTQVNLPRVCKDLTPAELLGKVRMTSTFVDYAQHHAEFRVLALCKLLWQQYADNLPIIVPQGSRVVELDHVSFQDSKQVSAAINAILGNAQIGQQQALQQQVQMQQAQQQQALQQQQFAPQAGTSNAQQQNLVPVQIQSSMMQGLVSDDTKRARLQYLANLYYQQNLSSHSVPSQIFNMATLPCSQSIPAAYQAAIETVTRKHPWKAELATTTQLPPPRDFTHINFEEDPQARDHHYLVHLQLNNVKLPALYDTGAAFTCISRGLAKLVGLDIREEVGGRVKGIEGKGQALAGAILEPVIRFNKDLQIKVSYIVVIPTEQPLMLLGNDIFGPNSAFAFLALKAGRQQPIIEVFNTAENRVVEVICQRGPRSGVWSQLA